MNDSKHYERRLAHVRNTMRETGIDLMFLNYGPDFTYLSGIIGPMYYEILKGKGDWITGMIVGLDQPPTLVLHKSFAIKIAEQTWLDDIRVLPDDRDPDVFLAGVLAEYDPAGKIIAVSKMLWGQTLLALQAAAPDARFVPATNSFMDAIRSIKDPAEIALMERAGAITDQAYAATVAQLKAGMTECDVATEVVYQLRKFGGEGPSFYPGIICVGNGSDPQRHIFTRNTAMVLAPGTTVAFDFGVLYQGYCSDFGRSVFIGEPLPEALAAYAAITQGTRAITAEMRAGSMSPFQICDRFAGWMRDAGFGEHYMYYGLGHAIGLEVHEEPWLRPGYDAPIQAGMCFTIEPKIWRPGVFYVRCEDVVTVEPQGGRSLTRATYEPIVIA